jgi:hypothetical protein
MAGSVPRSQAPAKAVEAKQQRLRRPPSQQSLHRCRIGGVAQSVSGGGMSFQAFLQMELAEAWLPQWQQQVTGFPGH